MKLFWKTRLPHPPSHIHSVHLQCLFDCFFFFETKHFNDVEVAFVYSVWTIVTHCHQLFEGLGWQIPQSNSFSSFCVYYTSSMSYRLGTLAYESVQSHAPIGSRGARSQLSFHSWSKWRNGGVPSLLSLPLCSALLCWVCLSVGGVGASSHVLLN